MGAEHGDRAIGARGRADGVHLVFFLHVTSGPESLNNLMALGFGLLIVLLLVLGSLRIMNHFNHMQMPMEEMMKMQR